MRPHKVIYDEQSQLYIVISGKYGQISSKVNNFVYKEKNGLLEMFMKLK